MVGLNLRVVFFLSWVVCRSVELGCEEEEEGKTEILKESLLVVVIKTGWES